MLKVLIPVLALFAGAANAQGYGSGQDGQSLFVVSNTQPLVYTGTPVRSALLASDTRHFRLICTTDCHYKRGNSAVVATISDTLVPAFQAEYFKVPVPYGNYISVVRDAVDGRAFLDELRP